MNESPRRRWRQPRAAGTSPRALLVLALLGACGADGPDAAAPRPTPASEQVLQQLRGSGVGVVASGCGLTAQLGSGVVVGSGGVVVTVAHTIAGATQVSIVDADGAGHDAIVTAFDKDRDLAVLRAPGLTARGLDVAATGSPTIGVGTFVTWNRDDGVDAQPIDVTKRLAITIEDIYTEEIAERSGLELAGDVDIGDSGGAVVGSAGDIVGIVYANSRQRDRVGFATDASEVRAVLATATDQPVPNGRCS